MNILSILSPPTSSPGRSSGGRGGKGGGGGEGEGLKEGELATTSLELFEFRLQFPCSLSCKISANQREAETSANINKH